MCVWESIVCVWEREGVWECWGTANSVLLMTAFPWVQSKICTFNCCQVSARHLLRLATHVLTPSLGAFPAPSIICGWRLRQHSLLGNLHSAAQPGPARPAEHGPRELAQCVGRSVSTKWLWRSDKLQFLEKPLEAGVKLSPSKTTCWKAALKRAIKMFTALEKWFWIVPPITCSLNV